MSGQNKYRLGLDLGTHSVGWAVLPLDNADKPKAISKAGVRIFSDGRHPKTGTSLAVGRRDARQMRRRRDRVLKRTRRLVLQLVEHNLLPETEEKRRLLAVLDPYVLRAKGLDESLEPYEFGRVMLHLSKRRGFKSNRKTDKKDDDQGVMSLAISKLQERLKIENCRTVGEWLAKRHAKGLTVRARLKGTLKADKAYDFYADRAMTEREFDLIWKKQAMLKPDIFNLKAHDQLKDTLLYQRDLLPVDPGRCTLLPDEKRAPLALPSVQLLRILQELNNIRIIDSDQVERPLTLVQRDKLKNLLVKQKSLTFGKIKSLLKLPRSARINLEDAKRSMLKGDTTSTHLAAKSLLSSKYNEMSLAGKDELTNILLNEASESLLVEKLKDKFGFPDQLCQDICKVSLQEGYGRLSLLAIKSLLPRLNEAVIPYSEAVLAAGLGSHSELHNMQKTGEILQNLPYYGAVLQRHVAFEKEAPKNDEEKYGKIANPTVHICLNQLRVVVNALIARYGIPTEINVEVTRDLKFSKSRKDEINKDQAQRQRLNEKYVDEASVILGLDPGTLNKSKRRELSQKMQLWTELNPKDCASRRCPFSGEQISIVRLLSEEVEIEHILPYSRTLDDSMSNKTLAVVKANRAKGAKTPWEAFGDDSHPDFSYGDILQRASLLPIRKARRFAKDGLESWEGKEGFLARALTDTAYISRVAREYLSCICPLMQIQAVPGRLTAMMRGKLGLNDLVVDNKGIKNREDHRHHAIDAIVVAITERKFLSEIAYANSRSVIAGSSRLIEEMPVPWATFHAHAKRAVDAITVSHRPNHGYQGGIMEDTAWAVLNDGLVKRRIVNTDSGKSEAKVKKLKVIGIAEENMAYRHGVDEKGRPKIYKGYKGGSNYSIEIYMANDKWKGVIVSTYEAYQLVRNFGEREGLNKLRDTRYTLQGEALIARFTRDDFISMIVDGVRKVYRVVVIKSSGQLLLSPPNEANVDARNRNKTLPYVSRTASSLQKSDAIPCTISPLGKVKKGNRPIDPSC